MGVLGLGPALLGVWACITIDTIFDPPDGGELGGIASTIRGDSPDSSMAVPPVRSGTRALMRWTNSSPS